MKVRNRFVISAAAFSAVVALVSSGASAQTPAFSLPGAAGNQAFGLGLGVDFTLSAQITVSSLGVFDDLGDGILANEGADTTLTAVLFNADTLSPVAMLDFTSADPGTLNAGFRYKPLATPLTLEPGNYDIAGYGFNAANRNFNSAAGVPTDNGGGIITYTGTRFSLLSPPDNMAAPPENFDSDVIKYGAGSFLFTAATTFVRTWTGAGADANWSTAGNFSPGPLTANNPLVFGAAARQVNNNDLSGYTANGLTFNRGGFVIGGNAFTVSDALVNQAGDNTINTPLTLANTGNTLNVQAGTLTLNGVVNSPFAPGGGFRFVTKSGGGTLVLAGANDLKSGLLISGGVVRVADIGDGATSNIGAPGQEGNPVAGLLAIYSGTLEVTGSGTQTTNRRIFNDQSGNPVLNVSSPTGRVVLTGQYRSNGQFGASLGKAGPGTLALDGDDAFFANTGGDRAYNFLNVQGGTLELGRSVGSAVDGINDVLPGATLKLTGSSGDQIFVDAAGAYGGADASRPGLVRLSGGTFDLNGNSESINRLDSTVAGSVVRNGAAAAVTLTIGEANLNGNVEGSYAGSITNGVGTLALTKAGAGTVAILTGANSYTGQTTVAGGTLRLSATADDPVISGAGGADIQNGRIEFDYAGGTSPAGAIVPLLDAAFDSMFASGQIRSTTAASNRGLGYRDDAANSRFVVAAALYGDTNLDGTVGFTDLVSLAQSYNLTSGAMWAQGDSNYDGAVGFGDLVSLAQNYNQSLTDAQADALAALGGGSLMADWALAQSLVPEPASLAAIGLAGVLGGRRRRAV